MRANRLPATLRWGIVLGGCLGLVLVGVGAFLPWAEVQVSFAGGFATSSGGGSRSMLGSILPVLAAFIRGITAGSRVRQRLWLGLAAATGLLYLAYLLWASAAPGPQIVDLVTTGGPVSKIYELKPGIYVSAAGSALVALAGLAGLGLTFRTPIPPSHSKQPSEPQPFASR